MNQRQLRVGFIGCGSHASMCIYPTFRMGGPVIFNQIRMPVELVAVADLDEEKACRTARAFGAARWYASHQKMLDQEKLDAVFIVVSPKVHASLCADVLARGLPVFVEKPPANDTAESRQLVKASRRWWPS